MKKTGEVLATGWMTFDSKGVVVGTFTPTKIIRGDIKVHVIRAEKEKKHGKV